MSNRPRKSGPAPLTPMKGHMVLKSSAFAPTQNKLSSQHMIIDHMNAHNRKISAARSAIDNKPPKSMQVSQKKRDQLKREAIRQSVQSGVRPSSKAKRRTPPPSQDENQTDEMHTSMADMAIIEQLVQDTQREKYGDQYVEQYKEQYMASQPGKRGSVTADRVQRQMRQEDMQMVDQMVYDNRNSPSSYRSPRTTSMVSDWAAKTGKQLGTPRKKMGGDLLVTSGHKFTEPQRLFTPRTLKTDRQSRLSQYKYYNPPKTKVKKENQHLNGVYPSRSETPVTEDMFDETLMSRDFNRLKQSGTVPTLDISVDADHFKWLKEQAVKAEARTHRHSKRDDLDFGAEREVGPGLTMTQNSDVESLKKAGTTKPVAPKRSVSRTLSRSQTMQRVNDEEEELKYLDFVSDVTNDVLQRGIFTNRVLKQVFEFHIEKNKDKLKISRMRALLDTLREDLGVPADNTEHNDDDVGMGTDAARPQLQATDNYLDERDYLAAMTEEINQERQDISASKSRPRPLTDLRTSPALTNGYGEHGKSESVMENNNDRMRRQSGKLSRQEMVIEEEDEDMLSHRPTKVENLDFDLDGTEESVKDEVGSIKSFKSRNEDDELLSEFTSDLPRKTSAVSETQGEYVKPKPNPRPRVARSRQTTVQSEDEHFSDKESVKSVGKSSVTSLRLAKSKDDDVESLKSVTSITSYKDGDRNLDKNENDVKNESKDGTPKITPRVPRRQTISAEDKQKITDNLLKVQVESLKLEESDTEKDARIDTARTTSEYNYSDDDDHDEVDEKQETSKADSKKANGQVDNNYSDDDDDAFDDDVPLPGTERSETTQNKDADHDSLGVSGDDDDF